MTPQNNRPMAAQAGATPRPKFSELALERQLLASAFFADHLMATNSVVTTVSRDELITLCHQTLLLMPDEAFD